jgi:hypothetical protein
VVAGAVGARSVPRRGRAKAGPSQPASCKRHAGPRRIGRPPQWRAGPWLACAPTPACQEPKVRPARRGAARRGARPHLIHEHPKRVGVHGRGQPRPSPERLGREVRDGAGAAAVDHVLLAAADHLHQPKIGEPGVGGGGWGQGWGGVRGGGAGGLGWGQGRDRGKRGCGLCAAGRGAPAGPATGAH